MMITEQTPYLNTREDGAFRFLGIPTAMRSTGETTNGTFGLIEHGEMPVGFASPFHTHHREDESFYVLEGEVAFVCGGKWLKAGPGAFVYGPREIAHGFKVIGSSPARMLLMCTPGGFERFVLEQTKDHRDRLIPFCSIDPRTTINGAKKGVEDMVKKYIDDGCRGFGRSR